MKILGDTWNEALITKEQDIKPRDYCYASELGQPLIDRYLKMIGEPYSNPPNERSRRKFFAGDVWEFVVWQIFSAAGILISNQQRIRSEKYPLIISGRLDFTVGGKPDMDKVIKMSQMPMSEKMRNFYLGVAEKLDYTKEIPETIDELKSLSSYAFEKVLKTGSFDSHNRQAFIYQETTGIPTIISYVCRDDARLNEFDVRPCDTDLITELSQLKGFLDAKERPNKEPLIKFEDKFSKNLSVEYSPYLTLIYGFKEPEDYRNEVDGKISRWNRVLSRMKDIKQGKRLKPSKKEPEGKLMELTANNISAKTEMLLEGWNADDLVNKFDAKIEEEE